jgi:hypothetical protein
MLQEQKSILSLLEFVKIDRFYVVCHFRCKVTKKSVISSVPFEPFEGKIELSWQEIMLHPIRSYNRYFHTPITIYGEDCDKTIVLKAFQKVADRFSWNKERGGYVIT